MHPFHGQENVVCIWSPCVFIQLQAQVILKLLKVNAEQCSEECSTTLTSLGHYLGLVPVKDLASKCDLGTGTTRREVAGEPSTPSVQNGLLCSSDYYRFCPLAA